MHELWRILRSFLAAGTFLSLREWLRVREIFVEIRYLSLNYVWSASPCITEHNHGGLPRTIRGNYPSRFSPDSFVCSATTRNYCCIWILGPDVMSGWLHRPAVCLPESYSMEQTDMEDRNRRRSTDEWIRVIKCRFYSADSMSVKWEMSTD